VGGIGERTLAGVLENKSLFSEEHLFLYLTVFHGKTGGYILIEE